MATLSPTKRPDPGSVSPGTTLLSSWPQPLASALGHCRRRRQDRGAGAGDVGIGRLAAGHGGEAALLDHVATVPGAALHEGIGLHDGVGLVAETFDADRREGC